MWTTEQVKRLISLVEIHRCLWDSTDKNRKKKRKINDAHVAISTELDIPVLDVKRKINSLRSQMSVERAKVAKRGRSGAGGNSVYEPKWEFYNSLLFIFEGESFDENAIDPLIKNEHEENGFFSQFIDIDYDNGDPVSDGSTSRSQNPAIPVPAKPSSKTKNQTKEYELIAKCIETIMTPSIPPPEKKIKTRSMAFIDSLSALLSDIEKDEPHLAIEFTKSLRNIYNKYSDRFDDIQLRKLNGTE